MGRKIRTLECARREVKRSNLTRVQMLLECWGIVDKYSAKDEAWATKLKEAEAELLKKQLQVQSLREGLWSSRHESNKIESLFGAGREKANKVREVIRVVEDVVYQGQEHPEHSIEMLAMKRILDIMGGK